MPYSLFEEEFNPATAWQNNNTSNNPVYSINAPSQNPVMQDNPVIEPSPVGMNADSIPSAGSSRFHIPSYSESISEVYGYKPTTKDSVMRDILTPLLVHTPAAIIAGIMGGKRGASNSLRGTSAYYNQLKKDQDEEIYARKSMFEKDPVNMRAYKSANDQARNLFQLNPELPQLQVDNSFQNSLRKNIGLENRQADVAKANNLFDLYNINNPNAAPDEVAKFLSGYEADRARSISNAEFPDKQKLQDERYAAMAQGALDRISGQYENQKKLQDDKLAQQKELFNSKLYAQQQMAKKKDDKNFMKEVFKGSDGKTTTITDAVRADYDINEGFRGKIGSFVSGSPAYKFNFEKYAARKAEEELIKNKLREQGIDLDNIIEQDMQQTVPVGNPGDRKIPGAGAKNSRY